MAEPGGIAVSRAVRDLVELRIEYAFIDGGEHTLKNVSRTVQIFHVQHAKAAVAAHTTTHMVPQVTLRFEGADSAKTKHSLRGHPGEADEPVRRHGDRPRRRPVRLRRRPSTVSRRHARLRVAGEALQVEDLGSTNGTKVGEQALQAGEPVALHAGNKLRLGDVDMLVRHL